MRLILGSSARMALGFALLAMVTLASTASAFPLRSPQVVFQDAALQGLLNGLDGGVVASAAQLDAQNFASNTTGSTDFVLVIEVGSNTAANAVGVYNAGLAVPPLYLLFPPSSSAGWTVSCRFYGPGPNAGKLAVTLFDDAVPPNVVGTTLYTGVTRDQFGFYIQGPGGTYYTQDVRNGGLPQVLTYQGTGFNALDLWQCFNDMPYAPSISTFDAVVLQLQSIVPTPEVVSTSNPTWGGLKALYR